LAKKKKGLPGCLAESDPDKKKRQVCEAQRIGISGDGTNSEKREGEEPKTGTREKNLMQKKGSRKGRNHSKKLKNQTAKKLQSWGAAASSNRCRRKNRSTRLTEKWLMAIRRPHCPRERRQTEAQDPPRF